MDFCPAEEPQDAETSEDMVSVHNCKIFFTAADKWSFKQDALIISHAKCQYSLSQGHLKEAYKHRERCINLLLPTGKIGRMTY